ncbi:hypothetical protein JXB27_00700 [Candidatus Woesearchaeota archaeon]|nr:hypothetical protein [Candidatus Woesearchaeota archaeon]
MGTSITDENLQELFKSGGNLLKYRNIHPDSAVIDLHFNPYFVKGRQFETTSPDDRTYRINPTPRISCDKFEKLKIGRYDLIILPSVAKGGYLLQNRDSLFLHCSDVELAFERMFKHVADSFDSRLKAFNDASGLGHQEIGEIVSYIVKDLNDGISSNNNRKTEAKRFI